ncbi:F-box protein At1g70590-like [Rosa rugosa]|uniref:F-box protein At1g70590-like n=1 Tax=Rosa rugosa TaxID=74645 RepID=UPI002B410445|nr:F-box protein At1g70590-like [Rosa rugosa]
MFNLFSNPTTSVDVHQQKSRYINGMRKRSRWERRETTAFPLLNTKQGGELHHKIFWKTSNRFSTSSPRDFSDLPQELVTKIGASLSYGNLKAASLVCKSWCDALRPARKAMKYKEYERWGKQFKQGLCGFLPNIHNALKMFLKAAEYGSTRAMVDAGLIYWKRGEKDKACVLYRRAAELGDRNAQFNLGLSYVPVQPPPEEAIKWLSLAAFQGHAGAQYQLAHCLRQGGNMEEAAGWCLRAAEGGYVRAMYNVSMCYKYGEGLVQCDHQARKWMKLAADCGHSKAQDYVLHHQKVYSIV